MSLNQQELAKPSIVPFQLGIDNLDTADERKWFAAFTVPQHEKSVVRYLDMREIVSFLPTYESIRVWKNRQRMTIVLPLFPSYVFVHLNSRERRTVLQSPGVLQIVGNSREYVQVCNAEIELLRSDSYRKRIEPFHELVIGETVRIKRGVMQGVQGTIVKRCGEMRFVLTLKLINQNAAIRVDADELEPVLN
jgi:transcription antitermination factor NusG